MRRSERGNVRKHMDRMVGRGLDSSNLQEVLAYCCWHDEVLIGRVGSVSSLTDTRLLGGIFFPGRVNTSSGIPLYSDIIHPVLRRNITLETSPAHYISSGYSVCITDRSLQTVVRTAQLLAWPTSQIRQSRRTLAGCCC